MAQEILTKFQVRRDSTVFIVWVEFKQGNKKTAVFWDVA
jgi:hypothetical protein